MTHESEPILGPDDGGDAPVRRPLHQWIALGLIVTLVSTLCLVAGRWQWNRHTERSEYADQVSQNYNADPVDLFDVTQMTDGTLVLPGDEVWRQVTVTGTYEPDGTVILRSRPVQSQHVFHILVPFVTTTGQVLVVNRGTVPMDDDTAAPDHVPFPPDGEVQLTANLRANEPATDLGAPDGQVRAINVGQVLTASPLDWTGADALPFYAQARSESPAAPEQITMLPKPSTSLGSHLSYAWQWLLFALGVWAAFIALIVRERRDLKFAAAEAAAGNTTSEEPRRPARRERKRGAAELEEDELIESQMDPDEEIVIYASDTRST